jgi:hypothetical protein
VTAPPPRAQPSGARPPGPPRPPAPPATGEPGRGVDPSDLGPPIMVLLDDVPLGDLGHPRVDARLLAAITLRGGPIARWLSERGIDAGAIAALPGSEWPLDPPLSWPHAPADPADPGKRIAVSLNELSLGDLGSPDADARLLTAILVRNRTIGEWLRERGITADGVATSYPSARWGD